jgi:hypothetical protein
MISIKYTNIKNCCFIFIFIFIAFLSSSCEQDLNIDIKTNDKRLLVDGEFTNDTAIHTLKLYCSGSLITGQPQTVISGAKVYVTDKIDTIYYVESNDTPGLYQTKNKCFGIVGHTYYLSISNIDVDNDGQNESYNASGLIPVPVKIDSMLSYRGVYENGDAGGAPAIYNDIYFKILYNGADNIRLMVNNKSELDIRSWIIRNQCNGVIYIPKITSPDSIQKRVYTSLLFTDASGALNPVNNDDTLTCNCVNLMKSQVEFLTQLANNSTYDLFSDNYSDQLKIPVNLPTNIQPSDKAAGYFFIYSVSRIKKVFKEKT